MKFYGRAALVGVVWSWLASVGTELMWLPTAMITARLLTPQDFGITATASFFIQLATRLTQFGFNAALLRMKQVDEEHSSTIFVMNVAMGAASWLVLAVSSPFIADFFHSPATGQILPIAALSFLAVPFGTVPSALLMRDLRLQGADLRHLDQHADQLDHHDCIGVGRFRLLEPGLRPAHRRHRIVRRKGGLRPMAATVSLHDAGCA
jgi:O-antigen/teichoic acid export membrane protein